MRPCARTGRNRTLTSHGDRSRRLLVREGGRIINVHALIAVGVNADGHREILGIDVATAEDGAGWLAFLRSLIARGLSGVQLVISDAHAGLVDAIGAVLPGASWQRCRTRIGTASSSAAEDTSPCGPTPSASSGTALATTLSWLTASRLLTAHSTSTHRA